MSAQVELKELFTQQGYYLNDDFLTPGECAMLVNEVEAYRKEHDLRRVQRKHKDRSLDYFVIDGITVEKDFPSFMKLYRDTNTIANRLSPTSLVPLNDKRASVNINITPPGGEYRWHYDRNSVTALLYLNDVSGGDLEFCPRYRWYVMQHKYLSGHQQLLDAILQHKWMRRTFGGQVSVSPKAGRLIVMRGDRCLHSVRPVTGETWRINVVMAYDDPERNAVSTDLDHYLYDAETSPSGDPNYRQPA